MSKIQKFAFNIFKQNSQILYREDGRCVLTDPGFYTDAERDRYFDFIAANSLKPEAVLLTHGHPDHIWGVAETLRRLGRMPVYMNAEDELIVSHMFNLIRKLGMRLPDGDFPRTHVTDGQVVEAAGYRFKVITTPGHTPGSVCYLEENERLMFTGDTLFAGSIGTTSLEFGDYDKEIVSLMDKLMILDSDITIYPGHGQPSTIGYERMNNPFLEPFNEKDTCRLQTEDQC